MIRRKDGYLAIVHGGGEYNYLAKLEEYERLLHEVKTKKPDELIEFDTIYGHTVNIRVDMIDAIVYSTKEALVRQDEDNKESEKEDVIS